MTETGYQACTALKSRALDELLAQHGQDLYRHVTVTELGEMVEEQAVRILRREGSLAAAA